MSKKILFDNIVVVDLEATAWGCTKCMRNNCHCDDEIVPIFAPKGEVSEIIEVGICLLNVKTLKISNKKSLIIKPEKSSLSEYCSKLTGLTKEKLNSGMSFKDACEIIKSEYKSHKRIWASYGIYDKILFKQQCEEYNIKYIFNYRHFNIKAMLPITLTLDKEVGLIQALKLLDRPMEGTHHKGDDDAYNAAQILSEIIRGSTAVNYF